MTRDSEQSFGTFEELSRLAVGEVPIPYWLL